VKSSRGMRPLAWAGLVVALTALTACGAKQRGAEAPREIDRLRAQFEAEPDNADVAARLAEAELFTVDGDPRRAVAPIVRLKTLTPTRASAHHLAGLERMMHGHMTEAAESFLTALELAKNSSTPEDAAIAESAIEKLISFGTYLGMAPLIREQLRVTFQEPASLGYAAYTRAGVALIDEKYREGDRDAAQAIAKTMGCPTEYRVAGPFGPRDILDFERSFPPERGSWERAYDLGPMRGVRDVRDVGTRGCEVHLGNGPYGAGGVTYAKTTVEVPSPGLYVLQVETPNSVMVWVDGTKVGEVDLRRELPAIERFYEVELDAGAHEILVKIATRHPNPILFMGLRERARGDLALPAAATPYSRYLLAERLVSRGHALGARELYRRAEGELGGMSLSHYVTIVEGDPLRPDDIRRDKARELLKRLLEQDPDSWYAIMENAALAAAEGRDREAIQMLREHDDRFPEVYGLVATLRDLLIERGFYAEGDRLLEKLKVAGPTSCAMIDEHLATALRRDRHADVARLAAELVTCDSQNQAMYNLYVRREEFDAAEVELERLAALEPKDKQARYLGARIYLARARGNQARANALLEELRGRDPRASGIVREQFDFDFARGQTSNAYARLDRALAAEPDAMIDLRFLRSDLGKDDPFVGLQLDGLKEIEAYKAAAEAYTQGSVLVLDYMVTRVFEDGSGMHLIHQIRHINSDEAVNDHGEFSLPDGADLILLRTVKADGSLLEPDPIGGKETISLPNLARGDFVESVYQYGTTAAAGMEGAVDGGRFIFENFEVPFHRSEAVYVYPSALKPVFEVRGDLPEPTVETRGGLVVRRYRVDRRMPPEREAMSVHPLEYFPSVHWGIGYTWDRMIDAVADMLADRDLADPAHALLAKEIAGSGSVRDRALRIHRWVMQNVESGEGIASQAAYMLESRSGSQARVVRYLLGLADIPSTLLFARAFGADQTKSEIASFDTYEQPVVRIGEGKNAIHLSSGGRNVPFGYLPVYLRGVEAIEVKRDGAVVTLPTEGVGADAREVVVDASLEASGAASLIVTEVHKGASAASWRDDLEQIPSAELNRIFEQAYASRLFPGANLEKLEILDAEDVEQPLTIRYVIRVPVFGHREGNDWILPMPFSMSLESSLARRPERKTTQIVGAVNGRYAMRVKVPAGVKVATLPSVDAKGPGGARFTMKSSFAEDLLEVERVTAIPLMRVPPRQYGELVRFSRQVDEAEGRPLRVRLR
jgi:cellulose synthase operon protein C